jgi:hypothetical protein
MLTHNEDAILTAQNPLSFANGILHVLNDPKICEKLKANALNTAQQYSIESVVDSIEYIYDKLLCPDMPPEPSS